VQQWLQQGTVDVTALSTGPYTVTVVSASQQSSFPQPGGHPHFDQTSLRAAFNDGSDMRSVGASGDRQRVYSTRVQQNGTMALIQVERSVEPEHQALGKLLAGLLIGGAGGIVLAGIGGWFLAGKSLAPVRVAFTRSSEGGLGLHPENLRHRRVGGDVCHGQLGIAAQPLGHLAHHAAGLQRADGSGQTRAGRVVGRGKGCAVRQSGRGAQDVRAPARTSVGHRNHPARHTTELLLHCCQIGCSDA